MSVRLAKLAELVGGTLCGDGTLEISGAETLRDAKAGQITLADDLAYQDQLENSKASAAVVSSGMEPSELAHIVVDNPRAAFATIVAEFCPRRSGQKIGVSPAAHVSPSATIGNDVQIYPGCVVGDDVEIADGCTLHANVTVMAGSRIGHGSTIFPGVTLYEDTQIGERVIIHAAAVIGAFGFGYELLDGQHQLSPQLGNVIIEADVEIGAGTTIDRGTYSATRIGRGTKIDNQVMIGHNCRIGRHNLLCGQVGIAGSCVTGDFVVMAGQVALRDHVEIADGIMIGGKSGVSESLTESGKYLGTPAISLRHEVQCMMARNRLPEMRRQLRRLERQIEAISGGAAREAA